MRRHDKFTRLKKSRKHVRAKDGQKSTETPRALFLLRIDKSVQAKPRRTSDCRPHRAKPRTTSARAKISSMPAKLPPHLRYDRSASSDLNAASGGGSINGVESDPRKTSCENKSLAVNNHGQEKQHHVREANSRPSQDETIGT